MHLAPPMSVVYLYVDVHESNKLLRARLIGHLLDVKREGAHSELCYEYVQYVQ